MPGLEDLRNVVRKLLKRSGSYEAIVKEYVKDLQKVLLSADVNVRLVLQLTSKLRERALKEQPPPGISRREWLVKITYEELSKLLGGDRDPDIKVPYTPYVFMLVGVQGSGKTTTAAKLAKFYRGMGYKVGLVAADVYRPAAYDQLRQLAEKVGALFYGERDCKDAVALAKRGVEELKKRGAEVIIIDTAGRHGYGEEQKLLEEMKCIASEVHPDEVVLVIDASMGQKAFELAKRFHEATPIGSIIVTKLDGTAKGGGALSAVAATGAQIKFIGTGEDVNEFEVFRPRRFVARLLGMGDLESLLERLERAKGVEELQQAFSEMVGGKINFRVVYKQLTYVRKLGPLKKVLQMIPGFSVAVDALDEVAKIGEDKIKKWIAAINSMTYEELDHPGILDRSRMRRIALGAGVEYEDVKELVNYLKNVQRMVKQLKRRKDLLDKLAKGFP